MDDETPTTKKSANPKKRLLIILGVIFIVVGALLFMQLQPEGSDKKAYVWTEQTVQHSTDSPSEQQLDDGFAWKGAANDPKKITISSQGIDGFIQKVGVDQNKQIAVPNNIHIGGWFVDSVRPGDKGLSIIDGHVNGRVSDAGIFKQLSKVNEGDTVTVTFGDNTTKSFKVFYADETKTADAAAVLFSQSPTVTNQLNLITCVGTFIAAEKTYDKRFIVQAELIK